MRKWQAFIAAAALVSSGIVSGLYAEDVPHAKIEASKILNDDLLNKLPKDSQFLREFLSEQAKSFYIGIDIPEFKSSEGHAFQSWPEVQTPGCVTTQCDDGHFSKIDVVIARSANLSDYSSDNEASYWGAHHGAGRKLDMLLVVSYVMPTKTAVLAVPFEITVWRDDKGTYGYRDLKVDLKHLAVSTTSEAVESLNWQ